MRTTTLMILSATAIALAGCGRKNEADTQPANVDLNADGSLNQVAPAPLGDQAFVNTAAASDAFEIAISKLALDKSASGRIKTFADQMVKAHTESSEKLNAATSALSPPLAPDPTLSAEQQATLDSLKAKTGMDFDTAYAAAQVDAHGKAVTALQTYAATGSVPSLKELAASLVPKVTAHLNMAEALKP